MQTFTRGAAVGVVALALLLPACSSGAGADGQSNEFHQDDGRTQSLGSGVAFEQVSLEDAAEAGNVVKQTRQLGLEVLGTADGQTLVTSPASTVVALTMLGVGAMGPTDEELTRLIGAGGEERDRAVNALVGSLQPHSVPVAEINLEDLPEQPQMHLANQVAVDDQAQVEQAYLDGLKRWFDAGILQTDLGSAEGTKALDRWVSENTAGLIKKSAIRPDKDLRLVLQNAVVFASKWTTPFDVANTTTRHFDTADDAAVAAEFLGTTAPTLYSELEGWQMIELPYGGDGQMVARFVLPPQGTDPAAATAGDLAVMEMQLEEKTVEIAVPKLDLETKLDLIDPLKAAGMTSVFRDTPPALRNISTTQDLVLTQAVQQGRFQISEEGTVAAAVTELGVAETSAIIGPQPDAQFIADRPYLIFIQDKTVGWDLFQVLVNDPTAE